MITLEKIKDTWSGEGKGSFIARIKWNLLRLEGQGLFFKRPF